MMTLYRPRHGRILGGVAAGLAYRFGLPVWLMRAGGRRGGGGGGGFWTGLLIGTLPTRISMPEP